MAGHARFESPSASSELNFAGSYSNGHRGSHSGPNLDRSGSFREGFESRMFGAGVGVPRGSGTLAGEIPPLSQCLSLEPITIGDQKSRSGELRRVMGFSVGSTPEDNSFGAAHMKPSPPVGAVEELKRFRSSVQDTCSKARGRAKKLDDHLYKLDKYFEAVTSKKQQRNEPITNDREGVANLKVGAQIYRKSPDLLTQKAEDRPKNVLLNKRVRTSMAETRAESRSGVVQRQPLAITKDRDLLKDSGGETALVEEKIRRLPAGGEGWDKKMKRKRSVGAVFTRPIDSDGELKRAVHSKVNSEAGLQSADGQTFRSGAPIGTNKMDSNFLPPSSSARPAQKNEQDGASLTRDLTPGSSKEKVIAKGSNKFSNSEDNHATIPSPLTKGKASRTPRTAPAMATSSSPSNPRISGTIEGLEQALSANKITSVGGASNRKRAMSSGPSSPPMAQWVGQRPQKMSRTRRANLVSPVSNHDERQISSDSCSPSDLSNRVNSTGPNCSLLSRNAANGSHQFKVALENVQSPARLSESEESGGGENKLKEKGMANGEVNVGAVQKVGPSVTVAKKNKSLITQEFSDGVRRQGRSGRSPSVSRASVSPPMEKLDNGALPKLARSRPGSEKNGSKSGGRPLKKMSDRKGVSRLGTMQNNGSPDCTGESDDDREELLAAANYARNACCLACSSSFWKKMEPVFAPVSVDDISFISQQLNSEEELHKSLPQMLGHGNNVVGDFLHEDASESDTFVFGERNGIIDSEKSSSEVTPLYQRVLSALIIEDNFDELEESSMGRNISLHDGTCDFASYDSCSLFDGEPRKRGRMDVECDSAFGVHVTVKRSFSCNGSINTLGSPTVKNSLCNNVHSEVLLAGISTNFLDGQQFLQEEGFGLSSYDCEYEQMSLNDKLLLELQSIGLYVETVPDLDDREDEVINHEIVQMKARLKQQIGKRTTCLEKLRKATGSHPESRDVEQVAMDRLVELAYRKLLATKGSSKSGVPRVSKQVALAFAKRTLARCRKFQDFGISCFTEPPLRDIIHAPPTEQEPDQAASVGPTAVNNSYLGSRNTHSDTRATSGNFRSYADGGSSNAYGTFNHLSDEAFAINGPILNRGRKKEVFLDDVGGATSHLGGYGLGGIKGKRSERDRDRDISGRSNVAKAGRTSQGSSKGDRKTKTKPKQRTAQLSTPENGNNKFSDGAQTSNPSASQGANNGGSKRKDIRSVSSGQDVSKESKELADFNNLPMNDLDPIDELGVVGNGLGDAEDIGALFSNFDDDLQGDFSGALDIPMDDLATLF